MRLRCGKNINNISCNKMSPIEQLTIPILPSSPVTSKRLPPPPPTYPWSWRCHKCRNVYRLSATRRCLECGHTFCIKIQGGDGSSLPKNNTRGRVTKRSSKRDHRTCSAEFDYLGWQAWGTYRRIKISSSPLNTETYATFHPTPYKGASYSPLSPATGSQSRSQPLSETFYTWDPIPKREAKEVSFSKERLFVSGRYDCSIHCDYPSECRHSVYKAWAEGRARRNGDSGELEMIREEPPPEHDDGHKSHCKPTVTFKTMSTIEEEEPPEVSPISPSDTDNLTAITINPTAEKKEQDQEGEGAVEWTNINALMEKTKQTLASMGISLNIGGELKRIDLID